MTTNAAPKSDHRLRLTCGTFAKTLLESLQERFPDFTDAEIVTSALLTLEDSESPATFHKVGKHNIIEGHSSRNGKTPIKRGRPKGSKNVPKEHPVPIIDPSPVPDPPTTDTKPKKSLVHLKGGLGFGNTQTHGV